MQDLDPATGGQSAEMLAEPLFLVIRSVGLLRMEKQNNGMHDCGRFPKRNWRLALVSHLGITIGSRGRVTYCLGSREGEE